MHERAMNTCSEESHHVTEPLEENKKNPAKKQEKSLLRPNQIQLK